MGSTLFPGPFLRQYPNGPIIATIPYGAQLTVLYGMQVSGGIVWVEVMDSVGRIGWIPQIYLIVYTPVPSSTPTPTPLIDETDPAPSSSITPTASASAAP